MAKSPPIEQLAERAAQQAGVDPALFRALILKGERSWKGWQTSPAGARGPAQLMPGTAAALERRYKINTKDYYGNLLGGAYYLKEQLDRFKDPRLAVAAYNAGPGAVTKYGGIPPYKETQNYVQNIISGMGTGAPMGATVDRKAPATVPTLGGGGAPATTDTASILQSTLPTEQDVSVLQRLGGTAAKVAQRASQPLPFRSPEPTPGFEPDAAENQAAVAAPPPDGAPPVDGLNATFAQRLQALIKAVKAAGGELYIFSGARDEAHQARLYQQALAKYGSEQEARRWVAPPGKSNHDTHAGLKKGLGDGALAADLRGDLAIAHKLAPKFGLAFPLSNEAWHIELAGARGR